MEKEDDVRSTADAETERKTRRRKEKRKKRESRPFDNFTNMRGTGRNFKKFEGI